MTSKTVNDAKKTYQYVGSKLFYQCSYTSIGAINKELYFFYDSYDNLTSIRCYINGNEYVYYTLTNIQGDIVGIYDANGNLVASYEYDAWGNIVSTTDTTSIDIASLNPIRYRGYFYDTETNLYYLQSRYYNPQVGRFLNADNQISGIGGDVLGYNLFAYCLNNPVNMSDKTGHWSKRLETTIKAITITAVIVTAVVLVAFVAAGIGGLALTAATISFGTACGGLVGGLSNEKKGKSFSNGCVGGAVNGFIQSYATKKFSYAGTIIGGGIGSGIGTALTEKLNNLEDLKSERLSNKDIFQDSLKAAAIGTVMSSVTAGVSSMTTSAMLPYGYNSWANSIYPGSGITPITPTFKALMDGFYSASDDALTYELCK